MIKDQKDTPMLPALNPFDLAAKPGTPEHDRLIDEMILAWNAEPSAEQVRRGAEMALGK